MTASTRPWARGGHVSARRRRRRPTAAEQLPPTTRWIRRTVLGVFGVFWGIPLLWLLIAPSKSDNELLSEPPLSWGSLEGYGATWTNLFDFNDGVIIDWTLRSIWYTGTALALAIITSLPAGYALATRDFVGRRILLGLTLVTMILPVSATVLPLFMGMSFVGLLNTPQAVILPMSFFPFGTYLAYIYYRRSIPPSLLEAAAIDGATPWQTFRRVALPLSKPILGLMAFIHFTVNWNRFFLPFVMLNTTDTFNLPLGLNILVRGNSAMRPTFLGSTPIQRPEVALAALVVAVPVAIVFILAQRYVISGGLTGATKE